MDVSLVIKQRLQELGYEQRDLATAAEVTESYISQLLTGKKLPPEPGRTDIYEKIAKFLKLPGGKLSSLADHQRKEELKKTFGPPKPLFKEVRELILRKCAPGKENQIRVIFEKQPFGELERLVTQKLLDVVKRVAKGELANQTWLRSVARLSGRSYEAMRVSILEFLDTDVFSVSVENCVSFLDPLIESWDIDLATFSETKGQSQPAGSVVPMQKYLEAGSIEKQLQLNGRKRAILHWAERRGNPAKKQKRKP